MKSGKHYRVVKAIFSSFLIVAIIGLTVIGGAVAVHDLTLDYDEVKNDEGYIINSEDIDEEVYVMSFSREAGDETVQYADDIRVVFISELENDVAHDLLLNGQNGERIEFSTDTVREEFGENTTLDEDEKIVFVHEDSEAAYYYEVKDTTITSTDDGGSSVLITFGMLAVSLFILIMIVAIWLDEL